jgi:Zn finger protein HypA/HybF involved in hydrogenase expression
MSKVITDRDKDVCECENCKYKTLKHFEECPKCFSRAYHKTIIEYKEEVDEERV